MFSRTSEGKGVADSVISSSLGIGLYTVSLLERSSANPIGEVSDNPFMDMGSTARRESSIISVMANTSVMGLSDCSGTLDLVKHPMSVEAVEATMRASCKLGGKSFKRRKKW